MSHGLRIACLTLVLASSSCTGNDEGAVSMTADASTDAVAESAVMYPSEPRTIFGGERATAIRVPSDYSSEKAWPLIVVLHGYSRDGQTQLFYSGLETLVEDKGVLLLAPNGQVDANGNPYWNATDVCCDFGGAQPDDSGYLRELIEDVAQDYHVDRTRIFLWGHSNGGFMAYRMACDHADLIAAIVSLAGSTWLDASRCEPSEPVSVLQIHGTADDLVAYEGFTNGAIGYPSATQTVIDWSRLNGCNAALMAGGSLDLDNTIEGEETQRQVFGSCDNDAAVELWTIEGGGHVPVLLGDFPDRMWSWFEGHPK